MVKTCEEVERSVGWKRDGVKGRAWEEDAWKERNKERKGRIRREE